MTTIQFDLPVDIDVPVHRIFIIDCSGSMCGTIDELRTNLKNKIPVLTRDIDFVSILWFNSHGRFGCLLEHVPVGSLTDVQNLNNAIDRYLRSGGSTHFGQAANLGLELSGKHGELAQIFFMTDGCENDRGDATVKIFSKMTCPVTIVGYGHYTDEEYLNKLADACGGQVITNQNFEKLNCTFDNYLANPVTSTAFEHHPASENSVCLAFGEDNELKIFRQNAEKCIRVPATFPTVVEFNPEVTLEQKSEALYLALLYALKSRNDDLMWDLLKKSGDVYFIKKYNNCFTKQEWIDLQEELIAAIKNPDLRGRDGIDENAVPADNCFTVVELLTILVADPKCQIFPYHPEFKYARIGKKTENSDPFYFVANKDLGSKIQLVYNKTRANVSINCTVHGHNVWIDGSEKIEACSTFRNYTVVKDGIKNVQKLAFKCSEETFDKLKEADVLSGDFSPKTIFVADVNSLPVVNRAMTKGEKLNAEDFCRNHLRRYIAAAHRKYVKAMLKGETVKTEDDGETAKREEKEKSEDFYVARELHVKLSSLSSVPAINEKLFAKFSSGKKFTPSEEILYAIHQEYEGVAEGEKAAWLTAKISELHSETLRLDALVEPVKFAILVCKKWFSDMPADSAQNLEGEVSYEFEGKKYSAVVKVTETQIHL